MSAQPISPTKQLILIYAPDNILKKVAAVVRAANPDAQVNLRTTDLDASMADGDECDRRLIVDSPRAAPWIAAYRSANVPIEVVRFVDGRILGADESADSAPFTLEKVAEKPIRLWDGRVVDKDEAYERTGRIYNVDLTIMSAWDPDQLEEAINAAYEVTVPKPEPEPVAVKTKKKKAK